VIVEVVNKGVCSVASAGILFTKKGGGR